MSDLEKSLYDEEIPLSKKSGWSFNGRFVK